MNDANRGQIEVSEGRERERGRDRQRERREGDEFEDTTLLTLKME